MKVLVATCLVGALSAAAVLAAKAGPPSTQPADPDRPDRQSRSTRDARGPSDGGHVRLHEAFASRALGNNRNIAVHLPPDYRRRPSARYPVLYLHDAEYLFDAAAKAQRAESRDAPPASITPFDLITSQLIAAGRIEPIIIVAIGATPDRFNEYTPQPDAAQGIGGRGRHYARFLVNEVKPLVDRTYRTLPSRQHTAVAGASLGGLIALYVAREHRDVFGLCGAIEPALGWADAALLREIEADPSWMRGTRFWLAAENRDGLSPAASSRNEDLSRRLERAMLAAGLARGRDCAFLSDKPDRSAAQTAAGPFDRMLLFFHGRPLPGAATSAPSP